MRPLLALLSLPLLAAPAWGDQPQWDPTPRIAVISAFGPEWQALRARLDASGTQSASTTVNGTEFITGTLEGKDVVLFKSGVSMVNAAMTTQLALDRYQIRAVIFSGIAGSADPALNVGDVVVPARWAEYLDIVLARETSEGVFEIPPFMTSDHPGFGMIVPRNVDVVSDRAKEPESKFWFDVSPELGQIAQDVAGAITLDSCDAARACLSHQPRILVGGNGLSGTAFVDNAAFRTWAHDSFDAQVLDMESAGVAHVAWTNQVPFLAVRSVSDLAGGGEGANEMATFMSLASVNSVKVVSAILADLAPLAAAQ